MKDLTRGPEDVRASAIEALGDHKAASAVRAISQIAELDGPLQGGCGARPGEDRRPASVGLVEGMQRTAGPAAQPAVAAALCLLGSNCEAQRAVLVRTLRLTDRPAGFLELLRTSASGLSALAVNGDVEAGRALVDIGVPAADPVRAPVALALARLAVCASRWRWWRWSRNARIATRPSGCFATGSTCSSDDFGEEQFFVAVRNAYFTEPEGSARRPLIQSVINGLEF